MEDQTKVIVNEMDDNSEEGINEQSTILLETINQWSHITWCHLCVNNIDGSCRANQDMSKVLSIQSECDSEGESESNYECNDFNF